MLEVFLDNLSFDNREGFIWYNGDLIHEHLHFSIALILRYTRYNLHDYQKISYPKKIPPKLHNKYNPHYF